MNKKYFLLLCLISLPISSFSKASIDEILKNANLNNLIKTDKAYNLAAQPRIPGKTNNVNSFDDFIAIGTLFTPPETYTTRIINFDKDYKVLKKIKRDKPWGGVAAFSQAEIPELSLQEGLAKVQACMRKKGSPAPSSKVTNVIIYKTQYPGQIVYDYSFWIPNDDYCQEILYVPSTKTCMLGAKKVCHIDFKLEK